MPHYFFHFHNNFDSPLCLIYFICSNFSNHSLLNSDMVGPTFIASSVTNILIIRSTYLEIIKFFPQVGNLLATFLQSWAITEHCCMILHHLQRTYTQLDYLRYINWLHSTTCSQPHQHFTTFLFTFLFIYRLPSVLFSFSALKNNWPVKTCSTVYNVLLFRPS